MDPFSRLSPLPVSLIAPDRRPARPANSRAEFRPEGTGCAARCPRWPATNFTGGAVSRQEAASRWTGTLLGSSTWRGDGPWPIVDTSPLAILIARFEHVGGFLQFVAIGRVECRVFERLDFLLDSSDLRYRACTRIGVPEHHLQARYGLVADLVLLGVLDVFHLLQEPSSMPQKIERRGPGTHGWRQRGRLGCDRFRHGNRTGRGRLQPATRIVVRSLGQGQRLKRLVNPRTRFRLLFQPGSTLRLTRRPSSLTRSSARQREKTWSLPGPHSPGFPLSSAPAPQRPGPQWSGCCGSILGSGAFCLNTPDAQAESAASNSTPAAADGHIQVGARPGLTRDSCSAAGFSKPATTSGSAGLGNDEGTGGGPGCGASVLGLKGKGGGWADAEPAMMGRPGTGCLS